MHVCLFFFKLIYLYIKSTYNQISKTFTSSNLTHLKSKSNNLVHILLICLMSSAKRGKVQTKFLVIHELV